MNIIYTSSATKQYFNSFKIFADTLECTMNPNRCSQFANCVEMSGTYGCSCMTGYVAMAGTSGQSVQCELSMYIS